MLEDFTPKELKRSEMLLKMRDNRVTFAQDYHTNTRGERMNFSAFPHIGEMYNTLAQRLVIQGSVQSFKSEFVVVDSLAAAYSGLSVFFVIPKYEARITYVQNRINRCVQNNEFYKAVMGDGFFDSVAIKSFGKGVIKYVSSNVPADFKEFPADILYVEEVDECNQENIPLAFDRVRASPYQFSRHVGNPKNPGEGINELFLQSDQREWYIPCLSCGKYSPLDWFTAVVKEIKNDSGIVVDYRLRDTEWESGVRRDIHCICRNCGGILDRESRAGVWIPKLKDYPIEGYHTSMLTSLINDVAGMYVRFKRALSDQTLLRTFYNSELGLPFSSPGSKITYELLDSCKAKGHNLVITESAAHLSADAHHGPCSMGVDVGHAFDVRISYVSNSGKRLALFIGKVKTVSELHDLMERYNVSVAVFDAEPETHIVKEIQDTATQTDVWLCKYKKEEGSTQSTVYHEEQRLINIDRTEAIDKTFNQFKRRLNLLPENYKSILDGEYGQELCASVREAVMDSKQRRRFVWSKCKDHSMHADVYDMLAAGLVQGNNLDVTVG